MVTVTATWVRMKPFVGIKCQLTRTHAVQASSSAVPMCAFMSHGFAMDVRTAEMAWTKPAVTTAELTQSSNVTTASALNLGICVMNLMTAEMAPTRLQNFVSRRTSADPESSNVMALDAFQTLGYATHLLIAKIRKTKTHQSVDLSTVATPMTSSVTMEPAFPADINVMTSQTAFEEKMNETVSLVLLVLDLILEQAGDQITLENVQLQSRLAVIVTSVATMVLANHGLTDVTGKIIADQLGAEYRRTK